MKRNIPKFRFSNNFKKNYEFLNCFLNPKSYSYNEFATIIFKEHPQLKLTATKHNLKNRSKTIRDYLDQYYQIHNVQIQNYTDKVTQSWQGKWSKVAASLEKILETSWQGINNITCYISICKIYPRFLNSKEFFICYLDNYKFSEAVIIHEITHFLYFEKWQELFPQDNKNNFEAPNKIWHLSEIMAPILNDDPELKFLIPQVATKSYPEYNQIQKELGNISLFNFFKQTYLSFKKEGKNLTEFLTFARSKIKRLKIGKALDA